MRHLKYESSVATTTTHRNNSSLAPILASLKTPGNNDHKTLQIVDKLNTKYEKEMKNQKALINLKLKHLPRELPGIHKHRSVNFHNEADESTRDED